MDSSIRNIDLITIGIYFVLVIIGISSVYSSSYSEEMPSLFSLESPYGKQIMWFGISIIIGFFIFLLRPDFIQKSSFIIYGFVMLLLILVLIIGEERNGAKAWFGFGSFGIQPAEFSKIAVALIISDYLARLESKKLKNIKILHLFILIFIPIVFIMLQPDLGSVLVFTAFILVLYREGLSGNMMIYGLLVATTATIAIILSAGSTSVFGYYINSSYILMFVIIIIALFILIYIKIFFYKRYRKSRIIRLTYITAIVLATIPSSISLWNKIPDTNYQKQRVMITLGLLNKDDILEQKAEQQLVLSSLKQENKQDTPLAKKTLKKLEELEKLQKIEAKVGYNIHKSLAAIGSGEGTGKGYKKSTLANNKFKWVPEQNTDFIFCTFAEEWGFIGGFILFTLFIILIIRLISLAERQRGAFGRVYIYSVACILFLHFTINIGMVMGIAPIIGIPLPFFSYGGSSLLAFSIMIFVALKLDADRLDVLS